MKAGIRFALWITLASAFALPSTAQQPPSSASSEGASQTQPAGASNKNQDAGPQQAGKQQKDQDKSSIQETGKGKVTGTSNDRLFYAMPNFLTLQGREKVPPLSSKDKFKVVALGTFDYFEYPWWGVLAAINQAENNEEGYGQGWAGYGKRYGSTAGDSLVENFLVGAVFPSILHQDPRFYQSGGTGFFKRSGYAISRIVVTRSDSGKSQFNYSEVFGSAIAAGISTYSYHPRSTFLSTPTNPHLFVASERTLPNTLATWETQLSLDAITIAVKEFWPDIHRKLSHKTNEAKPEGSNQH
ncbi:MAG TPA: hypothetical protein VKB49_13910 [Candidatus Sulfotelmatobacter sp.]|nr:hypothetical protein [Candidatus Sulfotelmatobacter sp.]